MTEGIAKDKDQKKTARRETLKMLIICSLTSLVITGIVFGLYHSDYSGRKQLHTAPESAEKMLPWLREPLADWSIVGMNHYHQNGKKYLFVAMVRDGRCIVEEGLDDETLWNRLCERATAEGRTR